LVATSDCFEGGVPLVVIEAWAAGIPVITPDHGAFSDLLDDVEVLKFPRGDSVALARSVERLTSDDQLSRTLAQGGHQRYLRLHSPKASLETLESIYHAVAAAGVRR
jgi:glycosyltransferase involved in cell wall biosynthesis